MNYLSILIICQCICFTSDNYYKEGASDKVVSLSQNSIFTKLSANQIFLSCTVSDSIGNDYGTCYKKTDAPCLFMKGGSSYQLVVAPSEISWEYSGNGSGHAQVSYSRTQTTPGGNKVYIYQTLSSDAGAIYVNVNGLYGRTTTAANITVALELADYLLF